MGRILSEGIPAAMTATEVAAMRIEVTLTDGTKQEMHVAAVVFLPKCKNAEILAAYRQGRKDFAAGRSINAPRYSDRRLDESWHRGQCDAMREKQPRLSRCR